MPLAPRRLVIVGVAVTATLLGGCGSGTATLLTEPEVTTSTAMATTAAAQHPFAGETAWIAYQTNKAGESTWLIHPDGTEDHQVAPDFSGSLILPNWSPDGQRLVMTSRGGSTEPLYEYDLQTEDYTQLFACEDPCFGDDEPVYSPDGTKVAFVRYLGPFTDDGPSDCGLWIGDLATDEVDQITSNDSCDREYFPRWSPDGSQLTYWRERPEGTAVFVINADGTNERQLTDWNMFGGDSDWSPDGTWIVFNTYPLAAFNFEARISNLYRIHADATEIEQLTDYESVEPRATQPRYTPDGDRIIFTAVTGSSRELWVMPSAGGEPIVVSAGGIYTHGSWQPQP